MKNTTFAYIQTILVVLPHFWLAATLANFFAFSFFAKMRKKFWILCEKSEENEEIAKGKKSPFLWQTELENDLPFFFIPFLCHNFLGNVIVWGKNFQKNPNFTVMKTKLAKSRKWPKRPFLSLFLCDIFPCKSGILSWQSQIHGIFLLN